MEMGGYLCATYPLPASLQELTWGWSRDALGICTLILFISLCIRTSGAFTLAHSLALKIQRTEISRAIAIRDLNITAPPIFFFYLKIAICYTTLETDETKHATKLAWLPLTLIFLYE